jgi:hypothetical protein
MSKYNEACNGCYFKETDNDSEKFKECWDCELIKRLSCAEPACPSNYVLHAPYFE